MKSLRGALLLLKLGIRIALFAVLISLQGCYQSEEASNPSNTQNTKSEIRLAVEDEPETTAESTQVLQGDNTRLNNLQNLLSQEYRDVEFLQLNLKATANEFLACNRDAIVSDAAAKYLALLLTLNGRPEFEKFRQDLESAEMLDTDSRAILTLLIIYGVKNYTLADPSYSSDLESALLILDAISEPTLLSTYVRARAYFSNGGPLKKSDEEISSLLEESSLIARNLESELSESDRFTSLMIEGMRLWGLEGRLQTWLQGESLCDDSAYFTARSLYSEREEYLRYRTHEYASQRVDSLIRRGIPVFNAKVILYDELVEFNPEKTGLADPSNKSQAELVMLAQQAFLDGVENSLHMLTPETWCHLNETELVCNPSVPFDSEYVEALLRLSEETSDSFANFELTRHFYVTGDIERSLFHKYSEYQTDREIYFTYLSDQFSTIGDLMLAHSGVASIPLILSIIEEYKSNYLQTPDQLPGDLDIEISRYEASLKLLKSLSESEGNSDEL